MKSRIRLTAGVALAAVLLAGCQVPTKKPEAAPSRFVRVEKLDGRWWFVQGTNRFLALGVNVVQPADGCKGDGRYYNALPKYDNDPLKWVPDATSRLRKWNFNTVAGWSYEELYTNGAMYHTRVLWLGPWGAGPEARLMDVFSDAYAQKVDEEARKHVAPHAEDPWLIGYFANNELPWYGQAGWPADPSVSLLTGYMQLPEASPSKSRAVAFLREFYGNDFAAFRREWRAEAASFDELLPVSGMTPVSPQAKRAAVAWSGVVAEQYFRLVSEAIRRYDTNHLFLGVRFAQRAQVPVMAACGKYADVVSLNHYSKSGQFDTDMVGAVAALADKPVMITEFSFRAMENSSGCPNEKGADVTVPTQQDRADRFRLYAAGALAQPCIVGYDWFMYHDQPPAGRFDGENSNYGLVDIHDQPYETLLAAITEVNGQAHRIHEQSTIPLPAYDPAVLEDYRAIAVRGGEAPLPAPHLWANGQSAIGTYADEPAGGRIDVGEAGATRTLAVHTGHGWGCGLTIRPLAPAHPDGSDNVLGATRIRARLRASKPFTLNVGLNESGHGPTQAQAFGGAGHADGEAYSHAVVDGLEGWQEYEFLLSNLENNVHHGNQRGNSVIDTDAIHEIGFYFPGNQGSFEIELDWVRLE